ncbi:MAG TPA: SCO family protein [Anaerolineales bacterium]|nr:SCO family protein [Anaerolineales bacterium]
MAKRSVSALIVLTLLLSACRAKPYEWHGATYEPPRQAAPIPFEATGNRGTFDLSAQAGHVVVLYFGYINCPDICPATLANLAWVHQQLGDNEGDLVVLFATVDPDRDTLPALANYLSAFDTQFIGLRAQQSEVDQVTAAYGVYSGPAAEDAVHSVEHSAVLFLIDRDGQLRAHYTWDVSRADLLADIEHLMSG